MPEAPPTQEQLLSWMQELSNWGRWGEDDQLGTLNLLSPEKTARAAALVQSGITVSCARQIQYEAAVDFPRPPQFFMTSAGDSFRPNEGPDRQLAIDYFGLIYHGRLITHVDSLAHFFWDGRMYNGFPSTLVSTSAGATSHSVDVAKSGIVTRGVLIDVPLLRGVPFVDRGDGISLEDIRLAEERCDIRVGEGDVLLLRTGQLGRREELGVLDPKLGSAGPKPELLPFLRERGIAMLGSDTPNDIQPSPYARFSNPVHQVSIVAMGLWLLDNAWLDDLSRVCQEQNRWEFMISILPLRIPNATGSPVNPVAIF
jgi:kynurenine formamidase